MSPAILAPVALALLLVCLVALFFKPARIFLGTQFDSKGFKAFRFITSCFAVITISLALLNWYISRNPLVRTDRANYLLVTDLFDKKPYQSPELKLLDAERDLFEDPFFRLFNGSWQSVATPLDDQHNELLDIPIPMPPSKKISRLALEGMLFPNRFDVNPTPEQFYLPPDSKLSIDRQLPTQSTNISIDNPKFQLNLKLHYLHETVVVDVIYKRKGFRNYIFYNYKDYDLWVDSIVAALKRKQDVYRGVRKIRAENPNDKFIYGGYLGPGPGPVSGNLRALVTNQMQAFFELDFKSLVLEGDDIGQ